MLFLKKAFNRRSAASIQELNNNFLKAILRDWDHTPETETRLTKTLLKMLDNGADINAQDHLGWTALSRLAIWGYTAPALALLDRGARIRDESGLTAVHGAAQNSNAELLARMLDKIPGLPGADSSIMGAAVGGSVFGQEDGEKKIACVKMLAAKGLAIGAGEKPGAYRFPCLAPYCPGLAEAKEIEAACETGDIAKIRELAAKGFPPDILADFGRDTPLFNAALKGDVALMGELIKLGSDVSIMCPWSDKTPLMAAAESGKIAALDLLIDSGAEVVPHFRYERHAYDEPGHSRPNLYTSSYKGGDAMKERVNALFSFSVSTQRRAKTMKPLKLGA